MVADKAATSVSSALLDWPAPLPTATPEVRMNSWFAVTSVSAAPLSVIMDALKLTLPAVANAPKVMVLIAT